MKKALCVVVSIAGAALWLFGIYVASFVVFGETHSLRPLLGGVTTAGLGAVILWYGRFVNRAVAVNALLVGVLLAVLAIALIALYGSKSLVEHLEFVFVGVVTGVFLWAWRSSWENGKVPTEKRVK